MTSQRLSMEGAGKEKEETNDRSAGREGKGRVSAVKTGGERRNVSFLFARETLSGE